MEANWTLSEKREREFCLRGGEFDLGEDLAQRGNERGGNQTIPAIRHADDNYRIFSRRGELSSDKKRSRAKKEFLGAKKRRMRKTPIRIRERRGGDGGDGRSR